MNQAKRLVCLGGLVATAFVPGRALADEPPPPVPAAETTPDLPRPEGRVGLGLEADVLPYVLSGAHGDVWAGIDGWRARAIAVTFTSPSFATTDGFTNQHNTIVELEIDRFFGPRANRFRGPWVAFGGGASFLAIDGNAGGHGSTTAFELSAGVGWSFPLPANFYLDPWVGAMYQFASSVAVGPQTWDPQKFAPQFGLKVGWNAYL